MKEPHRVGRRRQADKALTWLTRVTAGGCLRACHLYDDGAWYGDV